MNKLKMNRMNISDNGIFTASITEDCDSVILAKEDEESIPMSIDGKNISLDLINGIPNNGLYAIKFIKDGKSEKVYPEDESYHNTQRRSLMGEECQFYDIKKDMHYLIIMNKDGSLSICKWRTKVKGIKKAPYFIQEMKQEDKRIVLSGKTQFPFEPTWVKLLCCSRSRKLVISIKVSQNLLAQNTLEADLTPLLQQIERIGERWDFYLACNLSGRYMFYRIEHKENEKKIRLDEEDPFTLPKEKLERRLYDETDRFMPGMHIEQVSGYGIVQFSPQWQLEFRSVAVMDRYIHAFYEKITSIHVDEQSITIDLQCGSHGLQPQSLSLVHRENENEIYNLELISSKDCGKYSLCSYRLPIKDVDWQNFYFDFKLVETDGKEDYHIRIRNFSKSFRKSFYGLTGNGQVVFTGNNEKNILFPYYTQNDNVVLHYRPWQEYDEISYRKRERRAYYQYKLLKPFYDHKGIVLLYEKFCQCAQDNSLYMYEYMRKQKQDGIADRTYYIIDKRQPDASRFSPDDEHVIDFMSLKHMIYIQAAKLLVSIDTIKHSYQWRGKNSPIFDRLLTKKSVFLQHGVVGLKRVDSIYNRLGGNATNLFITSSPLEKEMVMKYFDYPDEEVAVTGLARFDVLMNKAKERTILFMPTWRNWIVEVNKDEFIKTEYYQHYYSLMSSKGLSQLAEDCNVNIIFCMHPKFRQFMSEFKSQSERIILFDYDKEPINELLMKSDLLVTDYSSVSWDMYYQKKPVIFYQFDYDRYIAEQGSYLDMEHDLFGDRVTNEEQLFTALTEYAKSDFAEKPQYEQMRAEYLPVSNHGEHRKNILDAIKKSGLI